MADQSKKADGSSSSTSSMTYLTEYLGLEPVQTLPGSLQSWIGKLKSRADSADRISLSREEGQDLIRLLSTASAAVAEPAPASDLVQAKQDLHGLKAHIRLGDYAAFLFNDLKLKGARGSDLKKDADKIHLALRAGDGTVRQALQTSVNNLALQGGHMDFATASFAIRAYAARNAVCHSETGFRKRARDWDGLAQQIDEDLSALLAILPEDELRHQDTWTRIIQWYRDRSIEQDEVTGSWEEKPPEPSASDLAGSPTLIDVRNLPLSVRPRAFHRGLFDVSSKPNDPTDAARRKIEAKSDPTPGPPLKRKASGTPEGEGPRKLRCVVPESRKANPELWDEYDRLALDASSESQELAEKDLGKSIQQLKAYRDLIKYGAEELEAENLSKKEKKEGKKSKADARARREAKVKARSGK
jgi:hypothetical protein